MKTKSMIAAVALIASGVVVSSAFAQTTTPPLTPAQRLQNLKARQDAAVAAAKARQNAIQRPVPTATPTATATAAPTTTTTAPKGTGGAPSVSSATPTPSTSALPKAAPVALSLDLDELKKTRPDRRKAELATLQARWGELLRDTRASVELKQHAQRTAYLQRIRALASKANDAKTVTAVDILITKEDARDADAMNALRSGALPTVAAGATK